MKYGNMSIDVANKYVLEAFRYVGYDYSPHAYIETRIIKKRITKKKIINQKVVKRRNKNIIVMHAIRDSKIDGEKLKGCITEITEELYIEMLKFGMELNNYTVDAIYKRFNNGERSYYVRAMLTKDKNMKKRKNN